MPRMVHGAEVVAAVRASLDIKGQEEGRERTVVLYTLHWLEATGYIRSNDKKMEDANRTFVLEPRAFEAMAQPLPKSLRGKKDEAARSVGDKLVDVVGGFGKEMAKETRKEFAEQLVGQVIGHAMKTFMSP